MTQYTRQFDVERASVDPEAGTFEAVLFTDGEASDGHVLNIQGGKIPDRMPLFVNHSADPTTQLGSLYLAGVDDHKVRVRGEVFTEGEGAPLEVRRDLLAKMAAGHVSRMSGRWDARDKDVKRRVNLPSDHPAFVDDAKETESRKRWGLYFEKWQAMEGSIVGLGADPQAVMRWARDEETPEAVRDFWREQVPGAQREGLLATLRQSVREVLDAGVTPEDVSACLALDSTEPDEAADPDGLPEQPTDIREDEPEDDGNSEIEEAHDRIDALTERLDALEARLADMATSQPGVIEDPEREEPEGEPLPPDPAVEVVTPQQVFAELREGLRVARVDMLQELRARLAAARGKVEQ